MAVKAVLISFDFARRSNLYYRIRCDQLVKSGRAIREDFPELQRMGHPKWREVDLDQEVGIWKRGPCSQPARQTPPWR